MEQLPMFGRLPKRSRKAPDSDHHKLVAYWFQVHEHRYGRKPIVTSRHMGAARDALKLVGLQDACKATAGFYRDDDRFLISQRHALWLLVPRLEKYLSEEPRPERSKSGLLEHADPTDAEAAALITEIKNAHHN